MAKNFKLPKHQTGRTVTTSTPYGSTKDMIVNDEEILSKIEIADDSILLEDDEGYYVTYKNRIDNGLADPLRHCNSTRKNMSDKINELIAAIGS